MVEKEVDKTHVVGRIKSEMTQILATIKEAFERQYCQEKNVQVGTYGTHRVCEMQQQLSFTHHVHLLVVFGDELILSNIFYAKTIACFSEPPMHVSY